jgi:hypothetical protein
VTALGIGIPSFLAGGFIGFWFGFLRVAKDFVPATGFRRFLGNAKLWKVSEWLTRIIVGLGLVQGGRIAPALANLGNHLREPLGGLPPSAAFGVGLVMSYTLLGFFYIYLWSRTLIARIAYPAIPIS